MKKRILSMILALIMIFTLLPVSAFAATIVDSGTCGADGDNVKWTLDSDGVLTISGEGEMKAYGSNNSNCAPWYSNRTSVKSVVIENGVTSIGNYAFWDCDSLTSVTIPDSVTSIREWSFCDCSSLAQITIPNSVTNIESHAFENCDNLKNVTIPNNITSISSYLFCYCSNLENVTIGDSVTSIDDFSFYCCGNLKKVKIPSNVTSIGMYAFSQCGGSVECYYSGSNVQWNEIRKGSFCFFFTQTTIHYNCVSGVYNSLLSKYAFAVFENQNDSSTQQVKYRASSNATINYNGSDYNTDENGQVKIEKYNGGSVTVSKKDYVSRTIPEKALKISKNIYLQKKSDYPVISAVWLDGTYDVMNENNATLNLVQSEAHTMSAEVDWGSNTAGSVVLFQNDKSVDITSAKSIVLSDYFDISNDLYVSVTSSEGKQVIKKLALKSSAKVAEMLESFKIDFGDSMKATLPDSFPFIGGKALKFGLYSKIPVKFSVKDGKVFAAIGAQVDINDDGVKSYAESAKKLRETMRTARNQIERYNAIRAFKPKGGTTGGSWGFDCGFSVMGFAEGYYSDDGKTINWLDGGVIMGGNVGVDYSIPFTIVVVPCYVEVGLSAELEAQLNLAISNAAKSFTPNGTLNTELALDVGAGVGIGKVATLGGGVTGKLSPMMTWGNSGISSFSLRGSINGYLKATALCFEYKHDFDPWVDKLIYQYPSQKLLMSALPGTDDDLMRNIYDTASYTLPELSYLESGSQFVANGTGVKRLYANAANSDVTSQFFTNSYQNAAPQLLTFADGTKLAVWTGYDASRSSINALCLNYSYYDGESWSEPAIVEDDGTMDCNFALRNIGGAAYLVWQDSAATFGSDATLDSVAAKQDISFAVFDAENGTFEASAVTANETADLMPVVCGSGDEISVVWMTNADNDIFANSGNSIVRRSFSGGEWSDALCISSGLASVESLDAAYVNGALSVAYGMDTDGDAETIEDNEIFLNGAQITDNDTVDSGVSFNNGKLCWYSGGKLVSQSGDISGEGLSSDRYQLLENNGEKALIFTKSSGARSTLCAMFYDSGSGKWGEPVELTDGKDFVASLSGELDDSGLTVMVNRVAVDDSTEGDPYGAARIEILHMPLAAEPKLGEIYFDEECYVVGNDLPISVGVSNTGRAAADAVLRLYDENGSAVDSVSIGRILSGTSAEAELSYTVKDIVQGRKLTVKLENSSGVVFDSKTITLRQEDITVENISCGINADENTIVYADIVNRGYSDSGELTVSLRKDAADGAVLETQKVDSLGSLDLARVCFETEYKPDTLYFITVECNLDESKSNNSDFVYVAAEDMAYHGDLNDDGSVNALDLVRLKKYISGEKVELAVSADLNGDGSVNAIDLVRLHKYLSGASVELH